MLLESSVVLKDIERSREAAFGMAPSKRLGTSATRIPMLVPLQGFRRPAEGAESTHGRGESGRFGVEKLRLDRILVVDVAQNHKVAKFGIN